MLDSLRSFVTGWTAKILLILLVGSFALWGVSGSILSGADTNTVARVGETKVSVRDFLLNYNRNISELQQRAGRRLTREEARIFGIEQQTLANVVAFATLDEYARRNNMSLSDGMLAKLIAENDVFKDSTGAFSRQRFQEAIYQAQMRESDFITLENKGAIRSQVIRSFNTGDILPEAFKSAMGTFIEEERNFTYLPITAEIAGAPAQPKAEELTAYFEANKERYKAPEFRKLTVVSVQPEDIADPKSIADETVAADYEARKDSYSEPEKRRVQQIVFKSGELADAAVKALGDGATFETVLADNGVKLSDADLGLIAKDALPRAIGDAAFALDLNTPSGILEGPFGPTMVRVTETQAAKVTPLEEVKETIRKELALRQAAESINTMLGTVEDMRAGGQSLNDIAKQLNLKLRQVEAIDRSARDADGNVISDLPESTKLLEQAFQTEVGAEASAIDFGTTGYIWYSVDAITQPRDRTEVEVTERLKADWTADQQAQKIDAKAQELKARVEKGESLDTLAVELGKLTTKTGFLKRAADLAAFPRNAVTAGFRGDAKLVTVVDGPKEGEKLLITVGEVKKPEARIVNVPESDVQLANQGVADDLLAQMIANLQNEYAVTQNPTAINYALTQQR